MNRVLLRVAYDGTNYCGWQAQDNGLAVEAVLNQTLTKVLKKDTAVIGASRTDSGVHARGNVAVFDNPSTIPPERFVPVLNMHLPDDIRIMEAREVPGDFHPRYTEVMKTYIYRIDNEKIFHPVMRLWSAPVTFPLDIEKMREGASFLVGTHDFKSYCSAKTTVQDTVRTIEEITITKNGVLVEIRIRGNGFLYNMVRIIAGTLIRVGRGFYPPAYVKTMLERKKRNEDAITAPACGLTLEKIDYPVLKKQGENTHAV